MAHLGGDADIASLAALLADQGRARVLLALGDGRALAASTLAAEAGVAASTASVHLAKLVDADLLSVEAHVRHRYYRLSGPQVAELLEALAHLAPVAPVRSLRQGTQARALRAARSCYDHLAGRLGTDLMAALLAKDVLSGGDGLFHPEQPGNDRLSAAGHGDVEYRLTEHGASALRDLGLELSVTTHRPMVRYCVDWSEQRHHLAGALGAALLSWLVDLDWVRRSPTSRALQVTDAGRAGLTANFGVELDCADDSPASASG
jgi:DNA-binding transcriptional ArsR family regulator